MSINDEPHTIAVCSPVAEALVSANCWHLRVETAEEEVA